MIRKTCLRVVKQFTDSQFTSSHNLQTDDKPSFHKFPSRKRSPERRDLWLKAVKKQRRDGGHWSPGEHLVLCGKHFITGKPKRDVTHPDYVPSVFPHKPASAVRGKGDLDHYKRLNSRVRKQLSFTEKLPVNDQNTCQLQEPQNDLDISRNSEIDETNSDAVSETDQKPCKDCENLQGNLQQQETEINFLRNERDEARARVAELETKLHEVKLSSSSVKDNNKKCQYFTGISWQIFQKTFLHLFKFIPHSRTKDSLLYEDQFFVTLVRLRLDLSFFFIGHQTGVPESTIRDYFWRWIDLIHNKLGFMIQWPSRESIIASLPSAFKAKFPRLTCIVDCFEIFIEQPKNLNARAQVWSNYKKHTTVKVFIACTPLGAVCYLPPAWGGRVSDVELVRSCGFISREFHMPQDQILADRGFLLHDDFATVCSAELITPAFTRGKNQLSAWEVEKSREMSSVRIHIERVIGLLKNRFKILQNTLPVTVIKSQKDEADGEGLASIDRLLRACAILANLSDSIVVKDI